MSKVDELLQRLQKEQVVIAEEEDFTNFIMSAIPEKQPKRIAIGNRIIPIITAVSSVAAALFLLFIGSTPKSAPENSYEHIIAQYSQNISCVDVNSTPGDIYRCYIEYRENRMADVSIVKQLKKQVYESLK